MRNQKNIYTENVQQIQNLVKQHQQSVKQYKI